MDIPNYLLLIKTVKFDNGTVKKKVELNSSLAFNKDFVDICKQTGIMEVVEIESKDNQDED